jgi:hypothetical protein
MNVTLCSAFRNAEGYIGRYFDQLSALAIALLDRGDHLYCVWGEGDHTDDTPHVLDAAARFFDSDIVTVNHGGQDYGSVVHPDRFANLSKVWNAIFERIPHDSDAVIVCESDLIWQPQTLLALLDHLAHVPAVSPMIVLERDGWPKEYAYDRWAFWRNGVQIRSMPPYFDDLDGDPDLVELDSGGSCMAMRGDVARRVTWPPEDVFRGLCRQIREGGDSVYLDMRLKVAHP